MPVFAGCSCRMLSPVRVSLGWNVTFYTGLRKAYYLSGNKTLHLCLNTVLGKLSINSTAPTERLNVLLNSYLFNLF